MKRTLIAAALLVLAPVSYSESATCGTGTFAAQREARLERVHELRAPERVGTNAAANVEVRDGIVLVDATEGNAPFRKPFDLAGRSVRYVPAGGDAFTVTAMPLAVEGTRGTKLTLAGNPPQVKYTLASFSFPFGAQTLREITIGSDFSIRTQPVPVPFNLLKQYDALEAATQRGPLIAPLLNPKFPKKPTVFVRDTADAVTISWTDETSYDIRATLHRNGTIIFSYPPGADPNAEPTLFGVAAVVPGSLYDRTDLSTVGSVVDPAGDADPTLSAAIRPAVDFTGATLRRVADLDLLRLDIDVAGTQPALGPHARIIYRVSLDGTERTHVTVLPGHVLLGAELRPVGFELGGSAAMRLEGTRMTIWLTEEMVAFAAADPVVKIEAVVFDGKEFKADTMTMTTRWSRADDRVERDLSAAASLTRRAPLVQGFTLPELSLRLTWNDVKNALNWQDYGQFDGVMFFQNFDTDLGLEGITGYASYGFSADRGLGFRDDGRVTLMHVNRLRRTPAFDVLQNDLLLHEFGHRWLFSLDSPLKGATGSDLLSPDGQHPAQWVDTRAAFQVHHSDACSSMGGAFFHETGTGTYKAGTLRSYGYSWLDLYAMGLAPASEVPPTFLLLNTSPALKHAYWAPAGIEVAGTRHPVTASDVIAELGPRSPSWPNAPRKFKVAFVLVRAPERAVTADELAAMRWERDTFVREFSLQTGGRGRIEAMIPPSKRRAARH